MKLLTFDIEASSLSADFGIVLCVGFKWVGGKKAEVLSIRDYDESDPIRAEKLLLKDVRKRLMEADCWIAHFGRWYDTVFINTRLLYHRLPTLPPNFPLIDTWKTSKNYLKLRNNRLITIQNFLHLKNEKDAIQPEQWIRAMSGHEPSLKYIENHCRKDVEVLEETYMLLRPLIVNHPNTNLVKIGEGCPVCGEDTLQKRGRHITASRAYQRFACTTCGSWSRAMTATKKTTVGL